MSCVSEPPRPKRPPTEEIPDSPDTTTTEVSEAPTAATTPDGNRRVSTRGSGQERKKGQPKIVSLFLRPHSGSEAFIPYNIQPRQLVSAVQQL